MTQIIFREYLFGAYPQKSIGHKSNSSLSYQTSSSDPCNVVTLNLPKLPLI